MSEDNNIQRVVVTDIRMPFISMVAFMVKAAIAVIPALLILTAIGFAIGFMLGFVSEGFY